MLNTERVGRVIMHIKASILIPVYNVENYIKECLDSIQRQTMTDFEVILIDDGSTDRSGEICDDYARKDSRFHVYHQKNQGVVAARENALQKAAGEYIFWCDADDYVSDDWLEKVFDAFDENRADIVTFGFQKFTTNGVKSTHICQYTKLRDIQKYALLAQNSFGGLVYWVARREFWENEHISGTFSEDAYTTARMFLRAGQIVVISDVLYHYRIDNSGSLTHILGFIKFKDVNMWEYRLQLCKENFAEEVPFCLGKLLHNAVRAYSLNLVFHNLTGEEENKALELLRTEDFGAVRGHWKDKKLRMCILKKRLGLCRWYAQYKIWKQERKNKK